MDFGGRVEADPEGSETVTGPRRNVARMHLLIFVYVGLRAAAMSTWFLYAALVFFFPWLAQHPTVSTGNDQAEKPV